MNKPDLSIPTRQELRGLLIIFAFEAQKFLRAFWPIFIVLIVQNKNLPEGVTIPIVLAAFFILLIIHAVLYYINFYFYIEENQFVLKKGYLKKKVLSIPLERIQSVNTKQNLLQQILGVYSLELDTAGSVGKELKIHSLSKTYAKALTHFLESHKTKEKAGEEINQTTPEQESNILRLSPSDLLRIGISQNHLRTGLIIIAFGSQIINQIQDLFQDQTDAYSESVESYMLNSGIIIITIMLILFLFISIASSLIITVVKYYDFSLIKSQDSYRISAGLLNKRNVIIPFNKVQQLNWETGPLKSIFGIFKISFKQAVSQQSRKTAIADAPGCLKHHISDIRKELFKDDLPDASEKIYAHPRYFNLLWFQHGWMIALLPSVLYVYNPWWLLAGGAWLIFTAFTSWMAVRKRYFQFNQTQLLIGKGAINTIWQQSETYKTQTIDFKQTFFQKRRGLASLKINNASGKMSIPYIPEKMAYQLMNYLLYHVETSHKTWM